MQRDVGKTFKVLIEGTSKKSDNDLFGRTDQNKVVVFAKGNLKPGEYVHVKIDKCTAGTLIGSVVEKS
jgi:tRNA-2-methylthio-N6-dimethylallyladenosine synthase